MRRAPIAARLAGSHWQFTPLKLGIARLGRAVGAILPSCWTSARRSLAYDARLLIMAARSVCSDCFAATVGFGEFVERRGCRSRLTVSGPSPASTGWGSTSCVGSDLSSLSPSGSCSIASKNFSTRPESSTPARLSKALVFQI